MIDLMSEAAKVQINLRVTPEEKAYIQYGAQMAGVSTHRFIVECALWQAKQLDEQPDPIPAARRSSIELRPL